MTVKHVVASITWNAAGWTRPSTDEERAASNFKNVREGHVGNESWNFAPDAKLHEGHKYGFFPKAHKMGSNFTPGSSLIFFWSKNHEDGENYIVGLWAMAESLDGFKRLDDQKHHEVFNLRVRAHPPGLLQPFAHHLPANTERHLDKSRIGQIGFSYISEDTAKNIVFDAMACGNRNLVTITDLYGWW